MLSIIMFIFVNRHSIIMFRKLFISILFNKVIGILVCIRIYYITIKTFNVN